MALPLMGVALWGCGGSTGGTSTAAKTVPTLTWATPSAIVYGTALTSAQLDATASVPGSYSYTPAAGTVEPAGIDTLSVTFTPTNENLYAAASATVSLTVNQATPSVTWATPASIIYGTPLGGAQLDATADVPGTFAYFPVAGTIEPLGSDTLSTTFTPTDKVDYTSATASVTLVVLNSGTPSDAEDVLYFVQQMVDLDNLTRYPAAGTVYSEIDSDDPRKLPPTATTSPSCFYCDVDGGNFYGDVTINGVLQHILLDVNGPGVVTHIEALGPDFAGHNIRIYLDNATTPALQADLQALMTGETAYISDSPLIFQGGTTVTTVLGSGVPTPGLNMYLPIPFAQHVLITYDGPENVSLTDQPAPILDWIVDYETLPAGTNVTSYSLTGYTNELPQITAALSSVSPVAFTPSASPGPFTDAGASSIVDESVPAGGNVTVDLPSGPNAIRFLRTNLGSSAATLMGVTLSMTFDGEETVNSVPVGDFFGAGNGTESGVGLNEGATDTQSATADGTLTSRWVMPYQTSASITITNTTSSAVAVDLLADTSGGYNWTNNSMHFHAYRRVNGPFETTNDFTTRFLDVEGSGIYVGDSETVYQHQTDGDTAYNWFGEGDPMFYVDGSLFPWRGTGTEDYYDFAYGNPSFFQAPWASQVAFAPQSSGETQFYYDGTTVFNRTRLLDAIPFTKGLRYDFEIDDHDQASTNDLQIDHTAFFYALPGASIIPDAPQSGSIYTIQSNASGWNLDATGGTLKTQIFEADNAQQFLLTQVGNYWTIEDVSNGEYIGVPDNGTSPGTLLGLVSGDSGCSMYWTLAPAAGNNDYYTLSDECSNLNMDLVDAATVPGTSVQEYSVNGTDAQQWRFNLVTGP